MVTKIGRFGIPSNVARWRKFRVVTPRSKRVFYVEWLRDESDLRAGIRGSGTGMCDTFEFRLKRDRSDFFRTSFARKNGYDSSCCYHDTGIGCRVTYFVNEFEEARRIARRQFGPRQV